MDGEEKVHFPQPDTLLEIYEYLREEIETFPIPPDFIELRENTVPAVILHILSGILDDIMTYIKKFKKDDVVIDLNLSFKELCQKYLNEYGLYETRRSLQLKSNSVHKGHVLITDIITFSLANTAIRKLYQLKSLGDDKRKKFILCTFREYISWGQTNLRVSLFTRKTQARCYDEMKGLPTDSNLWHIGALYKRMLKHKKECILAVEQDAGFLMNPFAGATAQLELEKMHDNIDVTLLAFLLSTPSITDKYETSSLFTTEVQRVARDFIRTHPEGPLEFLDARYGVAEPGEPVPENWWFGLSGCMPSCRSQGLQLERAMLPPQAPKEVQAPKTTPYRPWHDAPEKSRPIQRKVRAGWELAISHLSKQTAKNACDNVLAAARRRDVEASRLRAQEEEQFLSKLRALNAPVKNRERAAAKLLTERQKGQDHRERKPGKPGKPGKPPKEVKPPKTTPVAPPALRQARLPRPAVKPDAPGDSAGRAIGQGTRRAPPRLPVSSGVAWADLAEEAEERAPAAAQAAPAGVQAAPAAQAAQAERGRYKQFKLEKQERKRQRDEACQRAALVLTRMALGFVARRRAARRVEERAERQFAADMELAIRLSQEWAKPPAPAPMTRSTPAPAPPAPPAPPAGPSAKAPAGRPRPCRNGAACFFFRRGRCRFDHSVAAPTPTAAPAVEERSSGKHAECPICFEEMEVTIAIVPCGHTVCGACAQQVDDKCFTCSGPVQAKMRIFV